MCPVFTIIGDPGPELDRQREAIRLQIAFYGTTPSYSRLFEVHGRDDLTARLGAALRTGDQAKLAAEVDDELLDAFSVTASWDGLADALIAASTAWPTGSSPTPLPACPTPPSPNAGPPSRPPSPGPDRPACRFRGRFQPVADRNLLREVTVSEGLSRTRCGLETP